MCFFLVVVLRIVLAFSLPFIAIGGLYATMWSLQIYRAVRRARTSGLTAEYLIGTSICRLYYLLCEWFVISRYILALMVYVQDFTTCPNNILDIEPKRKSPKRT